MKGRGWVGWCSDGDVFVGRSWLVGSNTVVIDVQPTGGGKRRGTKKGRGPAKIASISHTPG